MGTPSNRRVVIIGGGIAGLSVAHFLGAVPGFDVTLVEREPRHNVHSSGRSAEIQRVAVPDPVTGALALETAEIYANPATASLPRGLSAIERLGLFVLSREDEPAWHANLMAAGAMKPSSTEELAACAPHYRIPAERGDLRVRRFEDAGHVQAPRLIAALARSAFSQGVRMLRSSGDASVVLKDGRARAVLTAPYGRIHADEVVIAAGSWSRSIGAALGATAPLRRTSRHIVEFERIRPPEEPFLPPPVVWDDSLGFYMRVARDRVAVSPCDTVDIPESTAFLGYPTQSAAIDLAQDALTRHASSSLPFGPVLRAWTGYRDLTPDDRPILGPDRRVPGLHWCAGLGGHGMTIGLAAGRVTALTMAGRAPAAATHCSVHRFD